MYSCAISIKFGHHIFKLTTFVPWYHPISIYKIKWKIVLDIWFNSIPYPRVTNCLFCKYVYIFEGTKCTYNNGKINEKNSLNNKDLF